MSLSSPGKWSGVQCGHYSGESRKSVTCSSHTEPKNAAVTSCELSVKPVITIFSLLRWWSFRRPHISDQSFLLWCYPSFSSSAQARTIVKTNKNIFIGYKYSWYLLYTICVQKIILFNYCCCYSYYLCFSFYYFTVFIFLEIPIYVVRGNWWKAIVEILLASLNKKHTLLIVFVLLPALLLNNWQIKIVYI